MPNQTNETLTRQNRIGTNTYQTPMQKGLITILLIGMAGLFAACGTNPPTPQGGTVVDYMPKSAKRGVSFSFTNLLDLPLLSPYISWDYNWGNTPLEDAATWFDANEMDFCPMCWNGNYNPDAIRAFVAAHPSTKYLLAFNEPNLTDQANMVPSKAAELWPPVVALAKELNLKLVSPAMNYGTLAGYSDPVKWLDEFFAQPGVSIDDVYAIAIHCYMASASAVKNYVERFEKYDKPIWMTEFCAWDPVPGSVNTQMDYMCAVLNYFEQNPKVERYAWFIPRSGQKVDSPPYMQLLTHDDPAQLTELGQMFCWFSPMNKNVWIRANRPIYASEYVQVSNNALPLRPTTDALIREQIKRDGLHISNFAEGQELTYQLYAPKSTSTIELRYCGYANAICEVLVDGNSANFIDLPRTGGDSNWTTVSQTLALKAGCHTITLKLFSGSCSLSALIVK